MMRLTKTLLVMVVACLMAISSVPPMAAQQLVIDVFPASTVIRGENIRVRVDPALDTSDVAILQRGEAITVTGESVLTDGDQFFPIEVVQTGDTGWVRALFIDPRSITATDAPVAPEVELTEDPATERELEQEARRQARQATAAESEAEPEAGSEDSDQDRAARRAAREADAAEAEPESEEPANDRAARRAARQAAAEADANADAGSGASSDLTFSGSTPIVTEPFTVPSGVLTVTGAHEGDGNFSVLAYTPDGYEDLLFNEIGPFSGETALEIDPESTVILDIEANGPWEVIIEPAF